MIHDVFLKKVTLTGQVVHYRVDTAKYNAVLAIICTVLPVVTVFVVGTYPSIPVVSARDITLSGFKDAFGSDDLWCWIKVNYLLQ